MEFLNCGVMPSDYACASQILIRTENIELCATVTMVGTDSAIIFVEQITEEQRPPLVSDRCIGPPIFGYVLLVR